MNGSPRGEQLIGAATAIAGTGATVPIPAIATAPIYPTTVPSATISG